MKTDIDRRSFLLNSTSALSLTMLPLKLWSAVASKSSVPPAPVARVEVVKDTYFGETLSDPYRWMENSKDPDLK
jgi:prolyl oligopeptidase